MKTPPTFSGKLILELMITEGNKQKRQGLLTLPLRSSNLYIDLFFEFPPESYKTE
jgi:hypothetical protein